MWQSFIGNLARNPLALKALAEIVAPYLRSLLKQETGEDFARLRSEVDALNGLAAKEIPVALTGLGARHQELAQAVESLRLETRELGARQRERETALEGEIARLGRELAQTRDDLRRAQAEGGVPGPRKWRPW